MEQKIFKILMVAAMMVLTGCQSYLAMPKSELDRFYIKKEDAEKNLKEVEEKYNNRIVEQDKKISEAKNEVINKQGDQIQAAANALYSVKVATEYYPKQGALDFTKYRTDEGMKALGKPPTVDEIIEGAKRLKSQIIATETNDASELEKLRKEHEKLMGVNEELRKNAEKAKDEMVKLNHEKEQISNQKENDIAAARSKAEKANKNFENKVLELNDMSETIKNAKHDIMVWCGIGAAIAMIGAIYSPVGKGGLALISAILGFISVGIMYLEPWMILAVGIIGIAIILAYLLYRHHISETSNENIINAIQDVREKSGESYNTLKNSLKEWNTLYTRDSDGNIIEVVDKRAENYVNEKLAKYGRLNTKK